MHLVVGLLVLWKGMDIVINVDVNVNGDVAFRGYM